MTRSSHVPYYLALLALQRLFNVNLIPCTDSLHLIIYLEFYANRWRSDQRSYAPVTHEVALISCALIPILAPQFLVVFLNALLSMTIKQKRRYGSVDMRRKLR